MKKLLISILFSIILLCSCDVTNVYYTEDDEIVNDSTKVYVHGRVLDDAGQPLKHPYYYHFKIYYQKDNVQDYVGMDSSGYYGTPGYGQIILRKKGVWKIFTNDPTGGHQDSLVTILVSGDVDSLEINFILKRNYE